MEKIRTDLTLEGYGTPAFGFTAIGDIKGESMDVSALQPYVRQTLRSKAIYDQERNELVLTVSTEDRPVVFRVDLDQASLEMKRQLNSFATGVQANTTLRSVSTSMIGMHIEPVVQ